jgi:hypothetical protein
MSGYLRLIWKIISSDLAQASRLLYQQKKIAMSSQSKFSVLLSQLLIVLLNGQRSLRMLYHLIALTSWCWRLTAINFHVLHHKSLVGQTDEV